jgi:hypothetical protein
MSFKVACRAAIAAGVIGLAARGAGAQPAVLGLDDPEAMFTGYWNGVEQALWMGPVRRFTFVGDFIDALRAQRYDHLVIIYYRRIPPEFQAPLLGSCASTSTPAARWR